MGSWKVTEATEAVSHAPKLLGRQSADAMKPVAGQKAAASALAETASPHVLEHNALTTDNNHHASDAFFFVSQLANDVK